MKGIIGSLAMTFERPVWVDQILWMPVRAWNYAMRHPERALLYSVIVIISAWFARLVLSLVALSLIVGSLYTLYKDRFL